MQCSIRRSIVQLAQVRLRALQRYACRGKCPLELAGYDISQVPMVSLCNGLSVAWPLEVAQNRVPNS